MSAGSAAADGFFRNWVFEGSLSGVDHGIERRPYHRNCRCALHDKSRDGGAGGGGGGCGNCKNTVSYKIRRSWSEGSLALAGAGASPSCSSNSSPHAGGSGYGPPPPSPSLQSLARSLSRDDLASAGNS
ncbi:unnamed protein product [Linum tenue]|uniref:Uncharacterized protein n=1 Tax=Linum tenue TaxID=586396 RepID=A0AAV0QCB4_9ROSI|nr:unnamed protein product [Linum tenue]